MKYLMLLCLIALTSCTSKTEFGPCIGLADDKDPKLNYRVSTGNLVVAVIFSELIVPPVVVALNELYCPIGVK